MDDHPTSLSLIFLLFFLILISTIDDVTAQNLANRPSQDYSATSFQPSLSVIICLLAIMFSLTFLLLLYAKLCHRSSSSSTGLSLRRRIIQDGLLRSASGLDKTLVQSLPFFRFSSLKGSREGLECAVCLSQFDDIEVLRMLPKCKHAFHIGCIDYWLEKHSTCPLCRRRVEADDLSELQYSSSLRFLWEQTELMTMRDDDEESNLELYVEREDNDSNNTQRSSRFSIVGGSFRRVDNKGKTVLDYSDDDDDENKNCDHFHKMNHKINIVSDIVLMKNRWSDVSSSDIMVLNSEMINDVSNERFSDSRNFYEQKYSMESMVSIKEEMERKRVFESKMGEMINNQTVITSDSKREHGSKDLINGKEKRSMSEIIVHPRLVTEMRNSNGDDSADQEEMVRSVWLPIARKTVQWFAKREKSPPEFHV